MIADVSHRGVLRIRFFCNNICNKFITHKLVCNLYLLKDERKRQKMTQKALAEKIGKKREYVSSLEKGQTDMQLSTFLRIANALGLNFSLVVG